MTKIYYKTFAQSDLDRERDEALSQRMAALSFVSPEHLDIPKQYHEESAWLRAIQELHKINSYKVQLAICCQSVHMRSWWLDVQHVNFAITMTLAQSAAADKPLQDWLSQLCPRGYKKHTRHIT